MFLPKLEQLGQYMQALGSSQLGVNNMRKEAIPLLKKTGAPFVSSPYAKIVTSETESRLWETASALDALHSVKMQATTEGLNIILKECWEK